MADFGDPGEPTPWKTTLPTIVSSPLGSRKEVTDEDLAAHRAKIMGSNYFEELAKLKQRIIDMMLN